MKHPGYSKHADHDDDNDEDQKFDDGKSRKVSSSAFSQEGTRSIAVHCAEQRSNRGFLAPLVHQEESAIIVIQGSGCYHPV